MLFKETNTVYCENHTKYGNTLGRMQSFNMLKLVVRNVTPTPIARQRLGKQARNKYAIPIARQRPQYTHATIEHMLEKVSSMRVRAMPIAKQRLSKNFPTNTQQ
jgi:hypothetical protein